MKHSSGFTRKDLVVVLCCIFLAATNFCAIGARGRRRAKEVLCLANLQKWGDAWRMFVDDNDGKTFEGLEWTGPLYPYYSDKMMLLCPAARGRGGGRHAGKFTTWSGYDGSLGSVVASYTINYWTSRNTEGGRREEYLWKDVYVKRASEAPLLLDGTGRGGAPWHHDQPPEYDGQTYNSDPYNVNEMRIFCIDRHNGGINAVFLDFSARKVGLKELWEIRWHRDWFVNKQGRRDPSPPQWPEWMSKFRDY